jgi:hypothetical protein
VSDDVVYQLWSPGINQWVECDKTRFDAHDIAPGQRRILYTAAQSGDILGSNVCTLCNDDVPRSYKMGNITCSSSGVQTAPLRQSSLITDREMLSEKRIHAEWRQKVALPFNCQNEADISRHIQYSCPCGNSWSIIQFLASGVCCCRDTRAADMASEFFSAVNRLLDVDGSRGTFSAIRRSEALEEVERLLAAAPGGSE